jgi:hypothetical protein
MKFYFTLQYHRAIRLLNELGLHSAIALIFGITAFLGLSKLLFIKTELAGWIYWGMTIVNLTNLGREKRNDQLKSIFNKGDYLQIRLLENGLLLFPFFLYLCWEQEFMLALTLIPISFVLATFTNLPEIQTTIPTPFKKFPFEFIIGFRKTFWFIFLVYLLFIKAIQVGNYNLSVFALAVLFFLSMSYYSKPEDEYYCWIFSMNPVAFLMKKIASGFICLSILTLPIFVVIIMFFPENIWITIAAQLLGYIYLSSMILAKYSGFPKGLNIAHGIFYGTSILFPPLLIIIIPIFYIQAKRRLTTILLGW